MSTAETIVTGLGLYSAAGLVFAILFVSLGLGRVDPAARGAKLSVRALLVPGSMLLWPLMAVIWLRGRTED